MPTTTELAATIPKLVAGQGHLFPLPFMAAQQLYVAPNYDHALYFGSPLPRAVWSNTVWLTRKFQVIYSDNCAPYCTHWEHRCWFGCPGSVEDGEYLTVDACSGTMRIKRIHDDIR